MILNFGRHKIGINTLLTNIYLANKAISFKFDEQLDIFDNIP